MRCILAIVLATATALGTTEPAAAALVYPAPLAAAAPEIAMPHASRADLLARFGADEIGNLAPTEDGASPRADAALADADAEIDSVLAEAYDTPLPPGEYPLLTAVAADLARARLYDDAATDRVRERAASARKRLREIVEGDRQLVDSDGAAVPRRAGSAGGAWSEPARFTRSALRDI